MRRRRTPLVALVTTALAVLTALPVLGAGPAAAHGAGTAPSPDAPHRGVVTAAHAPGHSPGRDRAVRAFAEGRRERSAAGWTHRPGTAADLTHNWWGIFPQPGTYDGITATHSVDPSYRVSASDNFTYAPTTKAQNSCMEVVTAYSNSGNEIWAWDWCSDPGGPAKVLAINADFLAKYTANSGGRTVYGVQLARDDAGTNSWSSYLYNYRTAAWELLFRQSGQDRSGLAHGWDMFEIYASTNPATGTGYYCTEAANTIFDSSSIQLRSEGAWKAASPSDSPWTEPNPDGAAFLCPGLRFVQAGANDHWTVRQ